MSTNIRSLGVSLKNHPTNFKHPPSPPNPHFSFKKNKVIKKKYILNTPYLYDPGITSVMPMASDCLTRKNTL
jgi:hypothetical protein